MGDIEVSGSEPEIQEEDEEEQEQEEEEEEIVEDNDVESQVSDEEEVIKKKRKRGIIYLSTIPRGMNVAKIREVFTGHGKVNRIFLQPGKSKSAKAAPTRVVKPSRYFTEGWVEFESKRVAKLVAGQLNNKMIGGRRSSKCYEETWNIKYLPRFKWAHLSERLAYEKATRMQRMRAEIYQAKKESNHFAHNLEISEKLRKWKGKNGGEAEVESGTLVLPRQRKMKDETTPDVVKLNKKKKKKDSRDQFLTTLFGKT